MVTNRKVVIFAPTNDAHAGALNWALQKNGAEVHWGPSLRFDASTRYSIFADSDGIHREGGGLFEGAVRSVWNRLARGPDSEIFAPEDQVFAIKQWEAFQRNAFALMQNASTPLWLNSPECAEQAENKLVQMRAAHLVGLNFPEMVVCNNARDVRSLLDRWGKVVLKTFNRHVWTSRSTGEAHSISVALLDREVDISDQAVAVCPSIYQRYVEKKFDVRVTVLGNRIYAVKIANAKGHAYMDWRPHILDDDACVEEFVLPKDVDTKIRKLMTELGLVVGFLDLVMDEQGDLQFLEVNQQGQFLFIEEKLPQMPLLRAMTSLLLTGQVDFAVEDSEDVHFADYLNSDAFLELRNAKQKPAQNISYEA